MNREAEIGVTLLQAKEGMPKTAKKAPGAGGECGAEPRTASHVPDLHLSLPASRAQTLDVCRLRLLSVVVSSSSPGRPMQLV